MSEHLRSFINLRNFRTLIALGLLVSLMFVFIANQRDIEGLRKRSLIGSSETIWRLNDVIVDTLHFGYSTSLVFTGDPKTVSLSEVDLQDVILRFELLWSKVDIALTSDLRFFESFYDPLYALKSTLIELDPLLLDESAYDPVQLLSAAQDVQRLGFVLQKTWQDSYTNQVFSKRELEQLARSRGIVRERLVLVLIAILVVYLLAEARIVSRAKRKEEDLRAEAKAASMANEAKSRFLANVSHEIRTPLNGIIGMSGELLETPLSEDQRSCLTIVSHAGDLLLKTLNDVLDLSKIESSEFELENSVFDLHQTLHAAVELYTASAREKQISLILSPLDGLPRFVRGDKQRVSQVLHNLIGNAIKFTENGTVTLQASFIGDRAICRFEVCDTGPGVDPSVQEKIFEPFSQADNSVTRSKGGTGLGLAISRSFCEAMGGRIGVATNSGTGSKFWFELPLPEQEAPIEASSKQAPKLVEVAGDQLLLQKKRLLIVDDNATNRFVLKRFLKDTPLQIDEAKDGKEAVEAASKTTYDVILMDIQMPVMDGITASNEIRKLEIANGSQATQIIAVTANVMTHQIEEYLAEGINEVLGKPVSKQELLAKLAAAQST
ncbi:ATP-binding protein [Shimia sp. R9_3]|uniref:ATP-binding protein n=1 Tax=Shimia sp. R9_3 TaxID=2821113 RepID=UPI001ADCCCF6|nr:ATP-binding protein [Shimia sp. R9_3]MBO9403203.1 response regulator [Shimia sp. R9_3]